MSGERAKTGLGLDSLGKWVNDLFNHWIEKNHLLEIQSGKLRIVWTKQQPRS